jgi:hypothetical protein
VARGKKGRRLQEPLVTIVGPPEHKDLVDLASGLRFVEGRAIGVPLSLAEEVIKGRRGYLIEPYSKQS